MLEMETKRFEDLEFQQLERESRQDEEKETHTQQLLREIADYQRSTVNRKASCFLRFGKDLKQECTHNFTTLSHFQLLHCKLNIFLKNIQERLAALKKQASQITQQAQREKESFLKERTNLEDMLQRVQ